MLHRQHKVIQLVGNCHGQGRDKKSNLYYLYREIHENSKITFTSMT